MIVSKFGGTSLATADAFCKVVDIVQSNHNRQVCVVSAPGRCGDGTKLTDLLLQKNIAAATQKVESLVSALPLSADVANHVVRMIAACKQYMPIQHRVVRGECVSALILADLLGWRFVPAQEVLRFHDGKVLVLPRLSPLEPVVVPGFYGWCTNQQDIRVFPRGGSDISAAHIAAGWKADVYENWTDVSGVYNLDPRDQVDAIPFAHISYRKLRDIAESGASVVHADAVTPVELSNIPLHVKNTFQPTHPGTVVT